MAQQQFPDEMSIDPYTQQSMPMVMDNPFSNVPIQNNLPPNTPIPEISSQMIDALLDDSHVKEKMKRRFFWVFARDNALTFLDEDRKTIKMMSFDTLKIDALHDTPYYDYTFSEEYDWNVMRNAFETKLDRALGFKGANTKNERTVQQSQFSESRNISEMGSNPNMQREGFLKRLLGRR